MGNGRVKHLPSPILTPPCYTAPGVPAALVHTFLCKVGAVAQSHLPLAVPYVIFLHGVWLRPAFLWLWSPGLKTATTASPLLSPVAELNSKWERREWVKATLTPWAPEPCESIGSGHTTARVHTDQTVRSEHTAWHSQSVIVCVVGYPSCPILESATRHCTSTKYRCGSCRQRS